ncbi:MAG: flagellar biosynthesis anti-sigma factor FlgM [Sarcina sp.]
MDINGLGSTNRVMNAYGQNKINKINKTEKVNEKDRIEISNKAKEMKEMDLEIKVDRSKDVERIRNEIKDGSYKVNSENLAKAIIEEMRGNKI